jgi:hypothetical protein
MHFFRTTKLAQKAEYPRMIWLRLYLHSVRYLAAPLFALRALLAARYLHFVRYLAAPLFALRALLALPAAGKFALLIVIVDIFDI